MEATIAGVRLAVLMLGLAGCGFSTSTGGPDDIPGTTPDAARPDGVGVNDSDGDGVDNADDNCRDVANQPQHDEDADGTGDACDPCPHLAGQLADADDDDDAVGNGCDPHPTTAGDTLVYWNGFHTAGASMPSDFAIVHGNAARFSVADGKLVYTRTNDDWTIPSIDAGGASHTVDTTVEIAASYNGIASAVGVVVDAAANDAELFECQVRTDQQARELWRWRDGAFMPWSQLALAQVTTPNDTYRIVLRREPGGLACTTTRSGQAAIPLANGVGSAQRTRAGLFARNVDARFRYVAIYRSP